jgi:hypothetical protein
MSTFAKSRASGNLTFRLGSNRTEKLGEIFSVYVNAWRLATSYVVEKNLQLSTNKFKSGTIQKSHADSSSMATLTTLAQ